MAKFWFRGLWGVVARKPTIPESERYGKSPRMSTRAHFGGLSTCGGNLQLLKLSVNAQFGGLWWLVCGDSQQKPTTLEIMLMILRVVGLLISGGIELSSRGVGEVPRGFCSLHRIWWRRVFCCRRVSIEDIWSIEKWTNLEDGHDSPLPPLIILPMPLTMLFLVDVFSVAVYRNGVEL